MLLRFSLICLIGSTLAIPADKQHGLMRRIRQASYSSLCNNAGCNVCNNGQCQQTCSGPQCSSCPNGNCCNGNNCNACANNACCNTQECNNCVNNCANNCQVTQPQSISCPQQCAQNCVHQNPIVIPPVQPPTINFLPFTPTNCNTQNPTESCQMTESTVTHKNTTLAGKLENQVNVSTVIHLNNVINNTNIINNPVSVNSTNVNNINILGYKYNQETDTLTGSPSAVSLTSKSDDKQVSSSSSPCCHIVHPQTCENIQQHPYRRCYRRRHRECSPACTQGFIQYRQPMYVQQPVQNPCHYVQQFPFVQCPQPQQPQINYGFQWQGGCSQCYTGCPPSYPTESCMAQGQYCTNNCGFQPFGFGYQSVPNAPNFVVPNAVLPTEQINPLVAPTTTTFNTTPVATDSDNGDEDDEEVDYK